MAKTTIFSCSNCDAQFPKWIGRCEQCGKWDTVAEAVSEQAKPHAPAVGSKVPAKTPTNIKDVDVSATKRIATADSGLDRVLGGGLVPGELVLLGGDPGVGKSTLLLRLAAAIPGALYISGEESLEQIALRAGRLGIAELNTIHDTHCESILATITKEHPPVAIIDSIQTIGSSAVSGDIGSVSQIRACTASILEVTKSVGTAIVVVGHVTKDGAVAGPKTLEHLVDAVLYLEGDQHHQMRVLRSVKNRFGSTDEISLYEMKEEGLQPVTNPTAAFLTTDRTQSPGTILTIIIDGKQPLLVEVQALATKTSFGYPQRRASGFDLNRLQLLIAVLTQHAKLPLDQYDVHVNIVGGMKIKEPAADLAVACAIVSSLQDVAFPTAAVAFGEIGLGGEVRQVKLSGKREQEAKTLSLSPVHSAQSIKHVSQIKQLF